MVDCSKDALKVEIDHLKKDMNELKNDQKEDRKLITSAIDILKENQIKQTIMMEQLVSRVDRRDNEVSESMKSFSEEMKVLRKDFIDAIGADKKWYQNFIEKHFGKLILILILIILVWSGIDVSKIPLFT